MTLEEIAMELKALTQRVERMELFFQIAADEQEDESKRTFDRSKNARREVWRSQKTEMPSGR